MNISIYNTPLSLDTLKTREFILNKEKELSPTLEKPTDLSEQVNPASNWQNYLYAAGLSAVVAAAFLAVSPPLAAGSYTLTAWLLGTSAVFKANESMQKENTVKAKSVRRLNAAILEINSCVAAAFLFPATFFESFHRPKGDLQGRPILMINGYLSFGSSWFYLRNRLSEAGCGPVYTMNIGSFDSIPTYAAQVAAVVKKIQEETGRNDIALICHSKGGLVGSYYATKIAPSDGIEVSKVVSIASPFKGTPIAKYGIGEDARQMRPDHPFVKTLRQEISKEQKTQFYFIASETDVVVTPSSALLGTNRASQRIFNDLGHFGLTFSSKTADQILAWLKDS